MINFNELPKEKPAIGMVIPKGTYRMKIVKGEMKQGQDTTKPMYLSIESDIFDIESGTNMGKFWFNLTESPAALPRYQLARFIMALKLPIEGEFELSDLTKMITNKEVKVDITPEETKDNTRPKRSVLDISAQVFYPLVDETVEAAEEVFTTNTGSKY